MRGLVFVLCVACSSEVTPPPTWTGTVDTRALPEEHAAVVASALELWRAADSRITATARPGGTPVTIGNVGEGHGGLADGRELHVLPCNTETAEGYDACFQIAAHELGHWLFVQHVADPRAIMYKDCTGATALTTADRQALADVMDE